VQKRLPRQVQEIYSTPALRFFIKNSIGKADLENNGQFTPGIIASNFTRLDDSDIFVRQNTGLTATILYFQISRKG